MRREAPSRIPVVVAGVALGGADHLGFCLQLVGAYRVGLAVFGTLLVKGTILGIIGALLIPFGPKG